MNKHRQRRRLASAKQILPADEYVREDGYAEPDRTRYFGIELDLGVGIFTSGLGTSNNISPYLGASFIYSASTELDLELSVHQAGHDDLIQTGTGSIKLKTTLIPITAGLRWNVLRSLRKRGSFSANLAAGTGIYIRNQKTTEAYGLSLTDPNPQSTALGAYVGVGAKYGVTEHVFVGTYIRYHLIPFNDEDSTLGGSLPSGARSGDYVTPTATLSFEF